MPQPPSKYAGEQATTPIKEKEHLLADSASLVFVREGHVDEMFTSNHSTNQTSSLISPTKLRQQAKRSAEVAAIEAWLEELFAPNSVPVHLKQWKIEANTEDQTAPPASSIGFGVTNTGYGDFQSTTAQSSTPGQGVLRALQDLQHANISADETKRLLHAARVEELERLQAQREFLLKSYAAGLLDHIREHLTPTAKAALDSLAEGGVLLGITNPLDQDSGHSFEPGATEDKNGADLIEQFARSIYERTMFLHELQNTLTSLQHLQDELSKEQKSAREEELQIRQERDNIHAGDRIAEPSHHALTKDEQMHAKTAQFTRETKHLGLKLSEYRDRITQLERALRALGIPVPLPGQLDEDARKRAATQEYDADSGGAPGIAVTTADVVATRNQRIAAQKQRISVLEAKLRAFNGLPADYEASRIEVRRATGELDRLKRRREELFEMLGGDR